MKKFLSIIFVLLLAVLFVGCGDKPTPEPENDPVGPNDPTPVEVTKYTVKFLVDGKAIDTQEVEEGENATRPADPKKEGYEFTGWDKEFTNVKSNLEVNALFKEIEKEVTKYIVNFLVDGFVIDTQEVEEGKSATRPADPKKDGYEFTGWDKEFTNVTANLEVNALFKDNAKYYTVEFVVNGQVINTQQVKEGESAVLPDQPDPVDGKYFAGWRKDTSNVTSDMKVNAIMTEVSFEGKTANVPLPIGKCELNIYVKSDQVMTKYLDTTLQQTAVWFCEDYHGLTWWYRVLINNVNGDLVVVELVDRGKSCELGKCDYLIYAYSDAMCKKITDTGVQVGDVIQFSTHPNAFYETTAVNESFTVKRYQEVTQYDLNSDVSHTVIALHRMEEYFNSLGVINVTNLKLDTVDAITEAEITWASSNPTIISPDGFVNLPDEATVVTLTATAKYGTSTYVWTYELTVSK